MSAAPEQPHPVTFRIHSGGRIYEIDAGSPAEARSLFARHHGNHVIDKIKANRPVTKIARGLGRHRA
jgi:hypothetical protein